jgi:hypothetical protein
LQWSDTDIQRLEDQVQAIAEELVFAGEWGYRNWQIRRHEALVARRRELEDEMRKRQQEAERRERERQARLIQERRDKLIAEAAAWRQANDLRAYVKAVLREKPDMQLWATWALSEADGLDPLLRAT